MYLELTHLDQVFEYHSILVSIRILQLTYASLCNQYTLLTCATQIQDTYLVSTHLVH